MASLIQCPGCAHALTLPDDFVGQRVQCPKCSFEFAAQATAIPSMEVDDQAGALNGTAAPAIPPSAPPPPLLDASYIPAGEKARRSAPPRAKSMYCIECGARFDAGENACPDCGLRVGDMLAPEIRGRRRPPREMLPVNGALPIVAAALVPVGIALFIAAPISDEMLRPGPRALRDLLIGVFCLAGGLSHLTAIGIGVLWLYQAWRSVQRDDEEYSPGLMVGLLFIPFFNFYWIFRAIPGLSTAIDREMKYIAPERARGSGWTPGLIGCIFALIPYMQPIALCIFFAWMLITNNALQRLIRINERERALLDEEESEPDRVD